MTSSDSGDNTVRSIQAALEAHIDVARRVAAELPRDVQTLVDATLEALRSGGKILFCGNGGSAADAQHLAAEYVVRFTRGRQALAALALTTDSSILTAGGNDLGFESIFERQVQALAKPEDLLVLHSTSGRSENLIRAARAARALGAKTCALLAKGGGALRQEVDLALVVPTDSTARAQELHLTIGHIVCDIVEESLIP
jgi:D-sedoheptulose 7-phosphate isomerase